MLSAKNQAILNLGIQVTSGNLIDAEKAVTVVKKLARATKDVTEAETQLSKLLPLWRKMVAVKDDDARSQGSRNRGVAQYAEHIKRVVRGWEEEQQAKARGIQQVKEENRVMAQREKATRQANTQILANERTVASARKKHAQEQTHAQRTQMKFLGDWGRAISENNRRIEEDYRQTFRGKVAKHLEYFAQIFKRVTFALTAFVILRGARDLIVGLAKSLVNSNAQLELFHTQLRVLTGNAERARRQMEMLLLVTIETPFVFDDLTKAMVRLTAFGTGTARSLKAVTDWAAAMNETATESAEAFGKIVLGSPMTRRLLETRGIPMALFNRMLQETGDRAKAIERSVDIMFGGTAIATSKTFLGVLTNISDMWFQIAALAGKPLFDKAKIGADTLYNRMRQILEMMKDPAFQKLSIGATWGEVRREWKAAEARMKAVEEKAAQEAAKNLQERIRTIEDLQRMLVPGSAQARMQEWTEETSKAQAQVLEKGVELAQARMQEELAVVQHQRQLEKITPEAELQQLQAILEGRIEITAQEQKMTFLRDRVLEGTDLQRQIELEIFRAKKGQEQFDDLAVRRKVALAELAGKMTERDRELHTIALNIEKVEQRIADKRGNRREQEEHLTELVELQVQLMRKINEQAVTEFQGERQRIEAQEKETRENFNKDIQLRRLRLEIQRAGALTYEEERQLLVEQLTLLERIHAEEFDRLQVQKQIAELDKQEHQRRIQEAERFVSLWIGQPLMRIGRTFWQDRERNAQIQERIEGLRQELLIEQGKLQPLTRQQEIQQQIAQLERERVGMAHMLTEELKRQITHMIALLAKYAAIRAIFGEEVIGGQKGGGFWSGFKTFLQAGLTAASFIPGPHQAITAPAAVAVGGFGPPSAISGINRREKPVVTAPAAAGGGVSRPAPRLITTAAGGGVSRREKPYELLPPAPRLTTTSNITNVNINVYGDQYSFEDFVEQVRKADKVIVSSIV